MPVAGEEAVPTGAVVLAAAGAEGAGAATDVTGRMAVFISDMMFSAEVELGAGPLVAAMGVVAIELEVAHC